MYLVTNRWTIIKEAEFDRNEALSFSIVYLTFKAPDLLNKLENQSEKSIFNPLPDIIPAFFSDR